MKKLVEPTVTEVRDRIETIQNPQIRYALKFAYLTCARAKEVVSKVAPSEVESVNAYATGPAGDSAKIEEIDGNEFVIFELQTLKRERLRRYIALPIAFEPWAKEVFDYLAKFNEDPVFNFTRQYLWREAKKYFKDWVYWIDPYRFTVRAEKFKRRGHYKNFTVHAIRHVRANELVNFYGFDSYDLSLYGGWTYKGAGGGSGAMVRYFKLNWKRYIHKLLKDRQ